MHVELRVTSRELGWPFILQGAWVVATLSVLLVGLGACTAGEDPCVAAGNLMAEFMLCLSFPLGVFFFVSAALFGWESVHNSAHYFEIWLGAFVVGYIQWFVLVPNIFGRSLITSLGLTRPEPLKRDASGRKKKRRAHLRRKPERFDTQGKTPVERMINGDR
jgi:hypothetical protein